MKPEGKPITCVNCGETGVLTGGLHKIGEHYECNNRQKCEAILAEKRAIMNEAKIAEAEKGIPNRYYCTACRKYHVKTSKVGREHTNFYLKEMPNANKRTQKRR